MAPTMSKSPTPTASNKMMGRRAGRAPATSTPPLHRREKNTRTPQLKPSSLPDNEDLDVVMTPAKSAAERAVDELPGMSSQGDGDGEDAFESARKKFAMYGKQNEHVSHYSPDQRQAMLERERQRALKRKKTQGSSSVSKSSVGGSVLATDAQRPPLARRIVNWDDADSTTTGAEVLKNTMLLQENGELAAQLDEIEYHLDGILASPSSSSIECERGYAMAQSVVALTQLLQEDQVQAVMKVASQSQQLYPRLREVLLLLRTATSHHMLTLTIAVMAYTLTNCADADEFFQEPVIDSVVACLESEAVRLCMDHSNDQQQVQQPAPLESGAETKTPLKKSFLKRKKTSALQRRVSSAVDDTVYSSGQVHADEGNAKANTNADRARTHAQRDERIRGDLREMLCGHDVFSVDGSIQLSLADLLCMILHNILQIGGASAPTSSTGGDNTSERSFSKAPQGSQNAGRLRLHQRQDLAGTTFEMILKRKQQLLRNRGLDLLLSVLANRIDRLQGDLDSDLMQASVSLDLASAFQRVRTVLRVLDQASFLASDVQLHMSKDPMIFRVTLTLIDALSRLAWSRKSRRKWQQDPGFMHLVVDVLLAALRVLINLSHQNEDANTHIAALHGTQVLFFAFCRLWGSAELEQAATVNKQSKQDPASRDAEDKVVYDALLLILSAITNCVEYSAENRALLSKIDLSTNVLDGLEAFRASSVCSLLVSFFVSKVQSYVHLIEMSESQRELEEEAWVPEDVILGGCASLLLGCLMKDSSYNSAVILGALPDGSPRLLLRALSAFVALHSQIGALTPEVGKSVLEVERVLKSFLFDGDESMMLSPSAVDRNGSSAMTNKRSPSQSGMIQGNAETTAFTIQFTVTPGKKKLREADVEEIKDGGDEQEIHDSQPPSQASQQTVNSPPASAFKLQRFKRVCSNVDDSDDLASDVDPSPIKPKKRPAPTPASITQSRPGKAKMVVNATVTLTPIRRSTDIDHQGTKSSSQRRLKRTRQLVSDLEAEFMKIGSRVSSEINAAAATMTSTEDTGDYLDFSQDLSVSQERDVGVKATKPPATPATPAKKIKRGLENATPTATTPGKQRRMETTPPTSSHKRKMKATPAKPTKKTAKTASANESVFDFPG